jgi:hypothetical protein
MLSVRGWFPLQLLPNPLFFLRKAAYSKLSNVHAMPGAFTHFSK